jgi:hypothetical protein
LDDTLIALLITAISLLPVKMLVFALNPSHECTLVRLCLREPSIKAIPLELLGLWINYNQN